MRLEKTAWRQTSGEFRVRAIGWVQSDFKEPGQCPHQGNEGAPEAWIHMEPEYFEALDGLRPGSEILVLCWMHLADRSMLRVHPRGDRSKPLAGVFATRSPNRPNPIGLHRTRILKIEVPSRILVESLELVDQTPVIDIKPVLLRERYNNGGR